MVLRICWPAFGFSGLSSASLVVENSYFDQDLNYTIRCTANTDCAIVNTVFSASVWDRDPIRKRRGEL